MYELQFRAILKHTGEPFYSEDSTEDESREWAPFVFSIGSKSGWSKEDFLLSQSTGFTDIDKQDIYEHDKIFYKGQSWTLLRNTDTCGFDLVRSPYRFIPY